MIDTASKLRKTFIVLILLMLVVSIFWINSKTPMMGEDFALSITYKDKTELDFSQKLSKAKDYAIFHSNNWNIRIGESLAIVLLSFDKTVFNILNTLAFILLSVFTTLFALRDHHNSNIWKIITFTTLSILCYLTFLPALGESFFWLTGSTNYLWALVFQISFVYFFCLLKPNKRISSNVFRVCLMMVLGFVAGLSNENTGAAIIAICILYSLFLWHNNQTRLLPYNYFGLIFFFIGYGILLFAPSTRIRQNFYNQAYGVTKLTIDQLINRLISISAQFFSQYKFLILIIGILLLLVILKSIFFLRISPSQNKFRKGLLGFVGMTFLSVLVMVAVPYYEIRSSLLAGFALIVALLALYQDLQETKALVVLPLNIALLISFIIFTKNVIPLYNAFYLEAQARDKILILASQNHEKNVSIPKFQTFENRRLLNTRESYLINNSFALKRYYDLESIEF